MTDGAQQALRRIMETCSQTTCFALACNTSDKVRAPSVLARSPPLHQADQRPDPYKVNERDREGEGAVH